MVVTSRSLKIIDYELSGQKAAYESRPIIQAINPAAETPRTAT
jgi:hypothetical protein